MYSHPEESNYMKKLLTISKKRERGRDKIKCTGNKKRSINRETVDIQWLRAEAVMP
jgi:hypothetical protein